jgi:ketosteroid isomerase-like protein
MVRNRRISMKNAKELMLEYTAFSFRDPKKAAEMFAEDGAFELPYLATFGLPTEYRGRDAIAGFFQSVLDIYPGFQFENTKVLIDTFDHVFAEFEATAVSSKTGRTVHQLFFSRLVAENGKIKLFREALNTFEVARANVQDSAGLF